MRWGDFVDFWSLYGEVGKRREGEGGKMVR